MSLHSYNPTTTTDLTTHKPPTRHDHTTHQPPRQTATITRPRDNLPVTCRTDSDEYVDLRVEVIVDEVALILPNGRALTFVRGGADLLASKLMKAGNTASRVHV